MKHIKYIISSLLFCALYLVAQGQTVTPSAAAGSFGKYVDQPVSPFTGTSNVSVPVASVTDGSLSHSVSLDYHTGGIRVSEIPSEVGLGWNLTAGGIITRTIRGLKDDDANNNGYWSDGDALNTTNTHTQQVANQQRDGEPDLFTYSFPGYSGKFIFDDNNEVVMIPKNNIKIEPRFNGFGGTLEGFILTTPDGTIYYFGYVNTWQHPLETNTEFQAVEGGWSQSISWRLVRIESFDKKHKIDFTYRSNNYKYKVWSDCSLYSAYYNGSQDFEGNCDMEELDVLMRATTLSKISTPTTEIFFDYNYRDDLYRHPNFAYDPIKLYRIRVKEGSSYCYKMDLSQSYFADGVSSDPGRKRLKLNQVRKAPCAGPANTSTAEQPWIFTYYGNNFFPRYLSKRIDHWGYYNGASTNDSRDNLIPYSCYGSGISQQCYGSAHRTTVYSQMVKGALSTVTYPTKGRLSFAYEANSYDSAVNFRSDEDNTTLINLKTCTDETDYFGKLSDEESVTLDEALIASGSYQLGIETYEPVEASKTSYMDVSLTVYDMTNRGEVIHRKSVNTTNYGDNKELTIELSAISDLKAGNSYKFEVSSYAAKGTFSIHQNNNRSAPNLACGGLRIKQTRLYDGLSSTRDIVRNFNYNAFGTSNSSGILNAKPQYAFQAYYANGVRTVIFNSTSISPLSSLDGYHIGYENVTVDYNGAGEKRFTFEKESSPTTTTTYPAAPPIAKIYQGNQRVSQTYKETGHLEAQSVSIRRTSDVYTTAPGVVYRAAKVRARISAGSNWAWRYVKRTYTNKSSLYRPFRITSSLDGVSSTTNFYYTSPTVYSPTRTLATNSDGVVTDIRTRYTGNYWSAGFRAQFRLKNRIAIPCRTDKYVGGKLLDINRTVFSYYTDNGNRTTVANINHLLRPYVAQRYERTWVNGVLQNGTWRNQKVNTQYHPNGLILKSYDVGWKTKVYDYNSNKLLTEIDYEGHKQRFSFHSDTRLMFLKTNVDGTTESYTYDLLMRLKTSKDNCLNITTTYNYYNYSNIISYKPYVESIVDYPVKAYSGLDLLKSRTYFDGLGRTIQKVENKRSATLKDYLYSTEYDNQGKVKYSYKIKQSAYNNGRYVAPLSSWLKTENHYYDSPSQRIEWTKPPNWYKTFYIYGRNDNNDLVRINGSTSSYPVGTLSKVTVRDPHNNKTITFVDRKGRTILKRKANYGETALLDTYNVYDNKDRVNYVLPPGAIYKTNTYQNLYYRYEYDGEDKLVRKWVPGAAPVYYKYKSNDLLGGYQDGNLRAQNKWYTFLHDKYGREVRQGFKNGTPTSNFTPSVAQIHTVYGTATYNKDKVTQVRSRVGATSIWLTQNNVYNTCGVLTSNKSNSIANTTANSVTNSFVYDGALNVTQTNSNVNAFGSNKNVLNLQSYDHAARPRVNWFKVDSAPFTIISDKRYNNEDELYLKYQGKSAGQYLQATNYTYNDVGSLLRINSNALQGTEYPWNYCNDPVLADPGTNYIHKDLFYLQLFYNTQIPGVSTAIRKDGNIAGMEWQVKGRAHGIYRNSYDVYSRLKTSTYSERDDGTLTASGRYNTSYNYDVRGNITNILRYGMNDVNGCSQISKIDDLTLSYTSQTNRLSNVTDSAPVSSRSKGFKNTNNTAYSYDANGNITVHQDKRIRITYNHLDLPTVIDWLDNNQRIDLLYDASGSLLRRTTKNGGTTIEKRDYVSGIEYVGNKVESIHNAEGRVFYINGVSPRYEYHIKDHLGNLRLQYSDLNNNGKIESANEILSESHYYPFGMAMHGAWMDKPQKESSYKYNGIERVEEFDLNLDFATYRTLDPSIGRWLQIDPMAEKYNNMSPYNSMGNNPIRFTDPQGDDFGASILIGMAISATLHTGGHLATNNFTFNNWDWGSFAGSVVAGGVGGGVGSALNTARIGGFYGGAILGASTGFSQNLTSGLINGNLSGAGLAKSTFLGAGIGGAIGGLDAALSDQRFLDGRSKILTERYQLASGNTPTTETSPNQIGGQQPMSKTSAIENGEMGYLDEKVVDRVGTMNPNNRNINKGFEGDLHLRGNAYVPEGREFYVNVDGSDILRTTGGRINTHIPSTGRNISWGYRGEAIAQKTTQHGLSISVTVRPNSYLYVTGNHRGWKGFLAWKSR